MHERAIQIEKEVLADGEGAAQGGAVERGGFDEAALRGGDAQLLAHEIDSKVAGEAVQSVTLGHR